jgi:hypothetical protein
MNFSRVFADRGGCMLSVFAFNSVDTDTDHNKIPMIDS